MTFRAAMTLRKQEGFVRTPPRCGISNLTIGGNYEGVRARVYALYADGRGYGYILASVNGRGALASRSGIGTEVL
jgi:hypothetical protein